MRSVRCAVVAALLLGCGGGGSSTDASDASTSTLSAMSALSALSTPLATARTLAAPQRELAEVLKGRIALRPERNGLFALPTTPGDLAMHVAALASEPTRIGTDEEHELRLSLPEARGGAAQADDGAGVHRDVFAGVDAVWGLTEARAELSFLLRDASAPSRFVLHLDWGSRLLAPEPERGGYSLRDDHKNVRLHLERPLAIDAQGVRRFAEMELSADGHTLTLALDTAGLTFPVLLDPAVAQGRWTRVVDFPPIMRARFSWDPTRNKLIGFGGYVTPSMPTRPGHVSRTTFEYVVGGSRNLLTDGPSGFTSAMFGGSPTFDVAGYTSTFDTARKKLLAFGSVQYDCSSGCVALNRMEVWEWDSPTNAWTQACLTGSACSLAAPANTAPGTEIEAVYDESRAYSVVCTPGTGVCARWNGTAWTSLPAFPSVMTRGYYDPTYGAATFLGSAGTYAWNGTAWIKRAAGTVAALGVTYDTRRKRAVALAGNGLGSDTYEWDGTAPSWTLVVPASDSNAPPNKVSAAIGYDRLNGRVVAYGGGTGAVYLGANDLAPGVFEYKAYGNTCAGDADCYGGSCRDGFCCDTKCGTCQRCDGPGNGGVCAPFAGALTVGTEHDTCTGANACDPAGACKLKNGQKCTAGTDCVSGSCVEGFCCNAPCNQACELCSATPGTCTPSPKGTGGKTSCGAGRCNGVARTCSSACASDTDCSALGFCSAGTCVDTLAQGTACGRDRQCKSGVCRDGFCCSAGCSGACETCAKAKGATADGTCTPLSATSTPAACAGYACSGTTGACSTSCSSGASCAAGYFCDGSVCQKARGLGNGCSTSSQCASGLTCADGVCCNSACDGVCQACSAAHKESGDAPGVCGPAKVGTDPGDRCPTEDASTCGKTGVCGAGGVCAVRAKGVACGAGVVCDAGLAKGSTCDGLGACTVESAGASCAPGKCKGSLGCTFKCTDDAECDATAYCDAGTCKARSPSGRTCETGRQCASGFCVDGVCCGSACTGVCEGCNGSGTEGTCTPIAGSPRPGHGSCPGASGDDACTAATCDGEARDACRAFAGPEVSCRGASCAEGVEMLAARCEGTGKCPAASPRSCAPFACGGARCVARCLGNDDCSKGNRCDVDTGKCVSSGACNGDHTIVGADGTNTECAPYRCDASGCLNTCKTSGDCAAPSLCDGSRCVLPSGGGGEDSGGCTASPRGARGSLLTVAVLMLISVRRRRARRASGRAFGRACEKEVR